MACAGCAAVNAAATYLSNAAKIVTDTAIKTVVTSIAGRKLQAPPVTKNMSR